jgi:uncharacterized membrane protein YqjE
MSDTRDDSAATKGLRGASARLAASLIGLLRTRLELASVEFSQTREHLQQQLVLLVVGMVALLFALLFVAIWIIAYYWDTNRLTAIAGVVVAFAAIGGFVLWRRADAGRTAEAPFAASLAELDKDHATFAGMASSRTTPPPAP